MDFQIPQNFFNVTQPNDNDRNGTPDCTPASTTHPILILQASTHSPRNSSATPMYHAHTNAKPRITPSIPAISYATQRKLFFALAVSSCHEPAPHQRFLDDTPADPTAKHFTRRKRGATTMPGRVVGAFPVGRDALHPTKCTKTRPHSRATNVDRTRPRAPIA